MAPSATRKAPSSSAKGTAPAPALDAGGCPSARTLQLVSNKWSVQILYRLGVLGVARFRELQRDLGRASRISQKELTKHLRRLEGHGLVAREVFPEVPPRVEYRLTPLGHSLLEPLAALARWGAAYDASRGDPT